MQMVGFLPALFPTGNIIDTKKKRKRKEKSARIIYAAPSPFITHLVWSFLPKVNHVSRLCHFADPAPTKDYLDKEDGSLLSSIYSTNHLGIAHWVVT